MIPKIIIVLIASQMSLGAATAQKKFLFDATKAETAGNADWVIDEDNNIPGRFPTPPESTVTAATQESYWTGALSSWGIALVKMGDHVETLPPGAAISFGDSTNPQDLRNYDVFIVDEPNIPFTGMEKTAIIKFVQNGGGLFMISDHAGADRNNNGWDAVRIWNDLMRNNSVRSLPFGILVDSTNYSETTTNVLADPKNPIVNGPAGQVTELKYSNGATITLDTSKNPSARGVIWRSNFPQTLTNVMFATASFGAGRVCLIGDSSPADDGSGASGNSLYPGWTEVGVSHANLHLNGSLWLAEKDSTIAYTEKPREDPVSFSLLQNYPDPFNPTTTIEFIVPTDGYATLKVYNVLGQKVATLFDGHATAGTKHQRQFNGSDLASGIYFSRLEFAGETQIRKMILLK
jgi:Secretion system C-terminal sorting domain